jgi:hypothetical protein
MTSNAHARFVALVGVAGGAFVALAAACSLDWSVRSDPDDAAGAESSKADVTVRDAGVDAPADVPEIDQDSGVCAALDADVANARAKAKECQIGTAGQCTTTVEDECACKVIVQYAGSAADSTYADAIAARIAANATCGKPDCTHACPQLGLPGGWACLANGSSGYACKP